MQRQLLCYHLTHPSVKASFCGLLLKAVTPNRPRYSTRHSSKSVTRYPDMQEVGVLNASSVEINSVAAAFVSSHALFIGHDICLHFWPNHTLFFFFFFFSIKHILFSLFRPWGCVVHPTTDWIWYVSLISACLIQPSSFRGMQNTQGLVKLCEVCPHVDASARIPQRHSWAKWMALTSLSVASTKTVFCSVQKI